MRDLHTPFGVFAFDPAALADAINRGREAREREVELAPSYPHVQIHDGRWCRQNVVGGRWWPIASDELHELLGLGEVA